MTGFLTDFCLFLADIIPTDFYSQMLCGLLLVLVLWAGQPGVGLRPLTPYGETFAAEIPLWIFNHHIWEWVTPFDVSALPTRLNMAPSVNPWL